MVYCLLGDKLLPVPVYIFLLEAFYFNWVWKVGTQGDKRINWKSCRENFWSFHPIQTKSGVPTGLECRRRSPTSVEKRMTHSESQLTV